MTLRLPLKILPNGVGLPLPAYATPGSAGLDVCAAVDAPLTLAPGTRALIPCGIAIAVPEGYEAQLRPRSGLALKHGVTVLNAPGTIDSDYRGEVKALLINHGQEPFVIERGMRIAQIVVAAAAQARIEVTRELDDTQRGGGGYGSTGGLSGA